MCKKIEIYYDVANEKYGELKVKDIETPINPLYLSEKDLVLLPSIEHDCVVIYEGERLAFDNGIIKVNCYKECVEDWELPHIEYEMKRALVGFVADLRDKYDALFDKLEEENFN